MVESFRAEAPRFSSPEEELVYLRNEVARREQGEKEHFLQKAEIAQAVLKETYPEPKTPAPLEMRSSFHLPPEEHDRTIEQLMNMLVSQGVGAALKQVNDMNNPHIADDFHRYLIQYVLEGHPESFPKDKGLRKALDTKLFEVTLPRPKEGEQTDPKLFIAKMEELYQGLMSLGDGDAIPPRYILELALPNVGTEVSFFAGVPRPKADIFEKQVQGLFPDAVIDERPEDYNVFHEGGVALGSVARMSLHSALPLRTYKQMGIDPLSVLLGAFGKLKEKGEGASVQLIVVPRANDRHKAFQEIRGMVAEGKQVSNIINPQSFGKALGRELAGLIGLKKTPDAEKEKEKNKLLLAAIEEKIASGMVVDAELRIVACAGTEARGDAILSALEASFEQSSHPHGNRLVFDRVPVKEREAFFRDFSYRVIEPSHILPLTFSELATLIHLPAASSSSSDLKVARAQTAPASARIPTEGIMLGENIHRGVAKPVRMAPADRLRHMYVIGQTGTGKTNVLKNMIVQDIKNGEGVCFIDPHGTDIQDILAQIPPSRAQDVIYFDPSSVDRPMGLNMLEYDPAFPEQKIFVINELLSIFNKLFDMKVAGGPMFEQYFRNATALVMEDPSSGGTLVDISRALANPEYRKLKLSRSKNPIVNQFWQDIASKAKGESALESIVPYITSKFDVFIANDIMRPIIGQEHSAFNFREVMDQKKILLVNLSKGRLGDINAHLIGLIMVGKILMAALSRVDMVGKGPITPFYLYIDEFQNVTTDSIATILSEARKYGLSLTVAHQYIGQLPENIKNAVFGNVGSLAAFRVGFEDAQFLEKQFAPVFSAADIAKLDNYHAYVKLLAGGTLVEPFSLKTLAPETGNRERGEALKELSHLRYGVPRAEIEARIMEKFKKAPPPAPPATP